jgi:hypothetical protein
VQGNIYVWGRKDSRNIIRGCSRWQELSLGSVKHYMRSSNKLSSWRSWSEYSDLPSGCRKWLDIVWPSPKWKKRHRKHQPSEKIEDGSGTPGLASTLSGNCLEWAALRIQQQE